jgi:hypothetical protein
MRRKHKSLSELSELCLYDEKALIYVNVFRRRTYTCTSCNMNMTASATIDIATAEADDAKEANAVRCLVLQYRTPSRKDDVKPSLVHVESLTL